MAPTATAATKSNALISARVRLSPIRKAPTAVRKSSSVLAATQPRCPALPTSSFMRSPDLTSGWPRRAVRGPTRSGRPPRTPWSCPGFRAFGADATGRPAGHALKVSGPALSDEVVPEAAVVLLLDEREP